MQLELAEGNPMLALRTVASKFPLYLLINDPEGTRPPLYVSEKLFYRFTPEQLQLLITNFGRLNDRNYVKSFINAVNVGKQQFTPVNDGEGSDTDYVETANTVVTIVDTVLGWFDGGSGGSGQTQNPGDIVNAKGLIICMKNIGGQNVLFGIHPALRQMIAFSDPAHLQVVFPHLPVGFGTTFPIPVMPSIVPAPFIEFCLKNPNILCREKSGGGFEIVPGATVEGYDQNGNPITNTPPPPGTNPPSGSGGGLGSFILPLLGLFALSK